MISAESNEQLAISSSCTEDSDRRRWVRAIAPKWGILWAATPRGLPERLREDKAGSCERAGEKRGSNWESIFMLLRSSWWRQQKCERTDARESDRGRLRKLPERVRLSRVQAKDGSTISKSENPPSLNRQDTLKTRSDGRNGREEKNACLAGAVILLWPKESVWRRGQEHGSSLLNASSPADKTRKCLMLFERSRDVRRGRNLRAEAIDANPASPISHVSRSKHSRSGIYESRAKTRCPIVWQKVTGKCERTKMDHLRKNWW